MQYYVFIYWLRYLEKSRWFLLIEEGSVGNVCTGTSHKWPSPADTLIIGYLNIISHSNCDNSDEKIWLIN